MNKIATMEKRSSETKILFSDDPSSSFRKVVNSQTVQSQTGSLPKAVCVQPFLQVFGADFAAVFFQIELVDLFAFAVFR